jgi:hypothetical protein
MPSFVGLNLAAVLMDEIKQAFKNAAREAWQYHTIIGKAEL